MPPKPFINPYNFVRYDPSPNRITRQRTIEISGHDRFTGHSGRLTCELTSLSRIFVGDSNNRNRFYRLGYGLPGIPGSSIKGVVRSVAEAISSSCFSVFGNVYSFKRNWVKYVTNWQIINHVKQGDYLSPSRMQYKVYEKQGRSVSLQYTFSYVDPNNLPASDYFNAQCKLLDNDTGLCIACRLFGSTTDEETTHSFAGKVSINDAAIGFRNANQEFEIHTSTSFQNVRTQILQSAFKNQHALSAPKPYHEPFYIENNKIRGRKFYYHQESDSLQNTGDVEMEVVRAGAVFQFTIEYQNLTDEELGLLCLALQLEWDEDNDRGIAHKIGMGKPLGLGSALIKIVKIEEIPDPADRYKAIQSVAPLTNQQQIQRKVQDWINALKTDDQVSFYSDGWQDLKSILKYPPYSSPVEYPGYRWFNNPANSSKELPQPGEVELKPKRLEK